MILTEHISANIDASFEGLEGGVQIAFLPQQRCEVDERRGDLRVLLAVHLLANGRGLLVEWFGLVKLALRAPKRSTTRSVAQQH